MADTSSIASRMEKLAQLKRMKLERAAGGNPQTNTPSSNDSFHETVQETAILPDSEASIAFDDEQNVLASEASPVEDATTAEPEAVDPFDDIDNSVSNPNLDDDSESIAIPAQEFDDDILSEVNEQDSDTELPADLLELEETSETVKITDARDSGDTDITENEVVAEDQEEIAGTPSTSEDDIDDEALLASTLGIDDDESASLDEAAAIADIDQLDEEALKTETPNFAENEIDPTVLEREFEHEAEQVVAAPTATVSDDGKVTVTFDESRSTLLNHVSRQMDCAPEDVVVTALDWYLDALFGEEGDEAKSA